MTIRKILLRTPVWLLLLVTGALMLFPIVIALFGSFKTNLELTTGATFLPSTWQFKNYLQAWNQADFSAYTFNSLYVAVFATVGTLLVSSMAAYAVDRVAFRGKKLFILLQSFTLFISIGAVVLRPQFDLMVSIGLQKSLWGVIIILISAHATAFFMVIGFFRGIPRELDEAALIDGCNFYSTFWLIILPLLRPALAVVSLFTFRNAWNEYILPLVFSLSRPDLQTLPVGLANLRYGAGAAVENQLMLAGACISIFPLLIVYIFANRSFMQVTVGSVKG
ncbi:ABC-type glycerol-3-phosphate transport system, permease component [Paenibacillus algorifonticola]|uniref:ABC-type glycerol-3-phosphate transport system, permease component n=1 Tax=Paenibacillus algorifonticola TaxID=684063 RepID=A0A1I2FKX8_9BACL|nr:carbohydrate ABC transporter permease [Paenibacillus algorifonticola]SFF05367.1 ABC-type glycerol-3-phosphate transport system, permease component [Paenibacillus algorifonticola]